jgi:hypothetical protein
MLLEKSMKTNDFVTPLVFAKINMWKVKPLIKSYKRRRSVNAKPDLRKNKRRSKKQKSNASLSLPSWRRRTGRRLLSRRRILGVGVVVVHPHPAAVDRPVVNRILRRASPLPLAQNPGENGVAVGLGVAVAALQVMTAGHLQRTKNSRRVRRM